MSDLQQLFDTDPLKLTDQDINRIVARMREAQAQFELGAGPKTTKVAATKAKSSKTADLLKDLGLG